MSKKISVILFALIIVFIPVVSLLSPYRTVSQQENRVLAAFPVFNLEEFTSKRFMKGFDSFVSDHIAFRDSWTAMKADISTLMGSRDNKGVYLGDNCLIENIAPPNSSIYRPNIDALNAYAKRTGKPAYLLLAPTAAEIERAKLPPFATTYDQQSFIKRVGSQLSGVQLINTTAALKAHSGQYIYYRTDHHWTSLGAYYAYVAAGGALGYTPLALSAFSVEHASSDFNGTLYSKSGYRSVTPDIIDFYTPKSGSSLQSLVIGTGDSAKTYDSIFFRNMLTVKDKYSAFFDGNQAYEDIRTSSGGKSLLVIKDSYAHSLVPFLMNDYARITMVDMRYLAVPLVEVVNMKDYDQVLFVYNVDTFNTDTSIQNIN
jgi:hypothetical protein